MTSPFSRPASRPHTVMQEREALRLEHIADLFTAKLEYERKQGLLLTEQIRLREEDLKVLKDKARHIVSSENPEERKMKAQIANLEHQIHLVSHSTAETQTYNGVIKQKIEGHRRDEKNYRRAIESLTKDLNAMQARKGERVEERLKVVDQDAAQRRQLELIRSKSSHQQFRQRVQIQDLESAIRQDLVVRDEFMKSLEANFKVSMLRALETLDPSPVQQALMSKWKNVRNMQKVMQAKHELDSHHRHTKMLEEAFQKIQEGSGILELNDIVTSIIKTREQQTSLHSHMNALLAEIDVLEEVLSAARTSITHNREMRESGKRKAIDIKADLRSKVDNIAVLVTAKLAHLTSVKDQLAATFAVIRALAEMFSQQEFQEIMITRFRRDDGINHESVMSYLADVDAGVSSLLTWLAYIRGEKAKIAQKSPQAKSYENLGPSIKGLIADLNANIEAEEVRFPLKEREIRQNAKAAFEQKFQQSYSTLTSTTSRVDRRRAVTPH